MSSKFAEKIYAQLRKVPKGKVTTYKELAKSIGSNVYRAVGSALRDNPYAPQVPCHRVVSSNGKIGGFKGFKTGKTIDDKIKMLNDEGVEIKSGKLINFDKKIFRF